MSRKARFKLSSRNKRQLAEDTCLIKESKQSTEKSDHKLNLKISEKIILETFFYSLHLGKWWIR